MGSFIGSAKYAAYGDEIRGGATIYIILSFMMSLFCYIAIKEKIIETDRSLKLLYAMIPITTFFVPLIYADGSMLRVIMYFQIYYCILIPRAIESMFPQKAAQMYAFAIAILMLLSIASSNANYKFMWEEEQNVWLYYK